MGFENGLKNHCGRDRLGVRQRQPSSTRASLANPLPERRFVLAHGLDPMEYAAVDAIPGSVLGHMTDAGARCWTNWRELLREGIHSHSEVRQGTVAEMLVDVARQYEAGLIVIGTKGMEGAGPVVVGAIAERLVRLATCPVLAVAADWNAGPHRPTPGGPVLLAMERNHAAPAAAATAASLAQVFDRPLLALHVRTAAETGLPDSSLYGHGGSGHPVRRHNPGTLPGEGRQSGRAVAEAIAENHPCILVAGVKRASGTPGPHGTAFALLSASRVPVLCVPPNAADAGAKSEVASESASEIVRELRFRRSLVARATTAAAAQTIPRKMGGGKGETAPFCPIDNRRHEANGRRMNRVRTRGDEGLPRACKRSFNGNRSTAEARARSLRAQHTARKDDQQPLEDRIERLAAASSASARRTAGVSRGSGRMLTNVFAMHRRGCRGGRFSAK